MIHSRRLVRARIVADDRGSVPVIFAITFLPFMLTIGAATDYYHLVESRSMLQRGNDSATLSVAARVTSTTTAAEAKTQAQNFLLAYPDLSKATVTEATVSNGTICATSTLAVQSYFMQLARINSMNATASSCASAGGGGVEIALVLDNSGSMAGSSGGVSKISALRTETKAFVNSVFTKSKDAKISIVPFSGAVKAVDPSNAAIRSAPWIDTQGLNSQYWIVFGGKAAANAQGFVSRFDLFDKMKLVDPDWDWGGCFEEPVYPQNVSAFTLSATDPEMQLVPFFAPDEPNSTTDWKNNYLADYKGTSCPSKSGDWGALTNVCKYKYVTTSSATSSLQTPNKYCPAMSSQILMPLSSDQTAILSKINGLQESGNTNLHDGLLWGMRTLSPGLPFGSAAAYGSASKVLLLMTDGVNDWNDRLGTLTGSSYQVLGYYTYNGSQNLRLPDGSAGDKINYRTLLNKALGGSPSYETQARQALDELTLEACANAKALGVEIYTLGFSTADSPIDAEGLNLLKTCATDADHFFKAANATDLRIAFNYMSSHAGKLRLTK